MPRYRRVADLVMERVAAGELAPGATVPSVRALAAETGATPATVGRAYAELGRLGVIDATPRRAGRVARDGAAAARRALHGAGPALRLAGSDDPMLDRLAGTTERVGARGSFGGLAALWQRRADAAAIHLRHRDGRYNDPFAARTLGDRRPLVVHLWRREQGILVPPGNPAGITGVADLPGHVLALRATGTGTRVLLERALREAGRDPATVHGPVLPGHFEAALAVASGVADAAVGLRAAADAVDLDFVPIGWEPYELILAEDDLTAAHDLLAALEGAPALAGFDLSAAGSVRRPS